MENLRCIDAGKEGCPCALAEGGRCAVCGKLSGGSCNDCVWQGVCVYTLFEQNGRKTARRPERRLKIHGIRVYSESFKVFEVRADKGFCQKGREGGTYVFVRRARDDGVYDTPVSVLKSEPERGILSFGICGAGVKSRRLLEEKEEFTVRGIYRGGLTDLGCLTEAPDETLIYGKGIAAAPLRNFIDSAERYKKILENPYFFYDPEKTGLDFFRDYFGDLPASRIRICDFKELDFTVNRKMKRNVFALTSPYYANLIEKGTGQRAVRPAEGNFCCGEGICGSCTYDDERGNTIHKCKLYFRSYL